MRKRCSDLFEKTGTFCVERADPVSDCAINVSLRLCSGEVETYLQESFNFVRCESN